jgi:hypothetical protein
VSSYRLAWQGRWADHASELERLGRVANGLAGELEQLQAWCGELAGELRDLAQGRLEAGDWPAFARLTDVANQLEHEAGDDGQTAADIDTADYLITEIGKLEYQAGAWGQGHGHF